jgi:hypothetical protein
MEQADPFHGDQLDRPYGDQESDYVVIRPDDPTPAVPEPAGPSDVEAEQEALAAAEARAIGGAPVSDETGTPDFDVDRPDPAYVPVEQAGGGQAEGFEQAEALLIEHAENPPEPELTADGFDLADPSTDVDEDVADAVAKDLSDLDRGDGVIAQPPDREALRASGESGEADEVHSSEATWDPEAGPDDPGRGPGLTFER